MKIDFENMSNHQVEKQNKRVFDRAPFKRDQTLSFKQLTLKLHDKLLHIQLKEREGNESTYILFNEPEINVSGNFYNYD
jgi:hypothetical protein